MIISCLWCVLGASAKYVQSYVAWIHSQNYGVFREDLVVQRSPYLLLRLPVVKALTSSISHGSAQP
jgi:hypothetical protein